MAEACEGGRGRKREEEEGGDDDIMVLIKMKMMTVCTWFCSRQ